MKKHLKLLLTFFRYTIQTSMIYRIDFIVWTLVTVGWFIFTVVFYQLIFGHITGIADWTKGQIFVLQGFYFVTNFLFWGIFYPILEYLPRKITKGEIDFLLTKPVNTQFLISFNEFSLNSFLDLFLGIGLMWYGFRLDNTAPSLFGIVQSILVMIIIAMFLYAGYFTTVCLSFWADRLENIVYFFPQIREFSKIPQQGYTGAVKWMLTFIIPAALIATTPSQFLFGDYNYQHVAILLIFAIMALKLSNWVFAQSIKKYSSASS